MCQVVLGNIGPRGCHQIRRHDCHLISLPKTEKASQYSNTDAVSKFLVISLTQHVLFKCYNDTCNKKTHKWWILLWSLLWSWISLRPPVADTEVSAGPGPGTGCGTGPAHVTGGRQGSPLGTAGPALGTVVALELWNTGEVAAAEWPRWLMCSHRQFFSGEKKPFHLCQHFVIVLFIALISKSLSRFVTWEIFVGAFLPGGTRPHCRKNCLYFSKNLMSIQIMTVLNLIHHFVKLVFMWDFVEKPYKYID